MKKNKTDNKFTIKEVFNPNAINIEEKMKEVFIIYMSEKLINVRNENIENQSKLVNIKNKKYVNNHTVEKI